MQSPGMSVVYWRRSSYSNTNGGNCVEVADGVARSVPVRDSKVPGSALVVSVDAWRAFLAALAE